MAGVDGPPSPTMRDARQPPRASHHRLRRRAARDATTRAENRSFDSSTPLHLARKARRGDRRAAVVPHDAPVVLRARPRVEVRGEARVELALVRRAAGGVDRDAERRAAVRAREPRDVIVVPRDRKDGRSRRRTIACRNEGRWAVPHQHEPVRKHTSVCAREPHATANNRNAESMFSRNHCPTTETRSIDRSIDRRRSRVGARTTHHDVK